MASAPQNPFMLPERGITMKRFFRAVGKTKPTIWQRNTLKLVKISGQNAPSVLIQISVHS